MVAETETRLGPLDFLVNNAGQRRRRRADLGDRSRRLVARNGGQPEGAAAVRGRLLPGMIARRRGRIVNMASGVGVTPFPYTSAYACSKVASDQAHGFPAGGDGAAWRDGLCDQSGRVRTAMVDGLERSEASRRWIPRMHPDHPTMPRCRGHRPSGSRSLRAPRPSDGDALAGRFIHVLYDFDEMRARAARLPGTTCTSCGCVHWRHDRAPGA